MAFYKGRRAKTDAGQTELFAPIRSLRDESEEFIKEWNSKIWLPKIMGTPRQLAMIRDAFRRPFFVQHWRETFPALAKSKWLREKMRPKFDIDFYLKPDNFDKILEGKYITEKEEPTRHHQATRNGDDEEII